jgi:hypothetical protein
VKLDLKWLKEEKKREGVNLHAASGFLFTLSVHKFELYSWRIGRFWRFFAYHIGGIKMIDRRALYEDWKGFESRGVPLEPLQFRLRSLGRSSDGLVVRPLEGPAWAMITELDSGAFGYVLEPFILQTGPGKIIIMDSWLVVPWEDPLIEWLPDPASVVPRDLMYALDKTLKFPREEVLNHRLKGALRRGDIRQGVLLGRGSIPPPDTYKNGAKITVTLRVVDQWGERHSGLFKMQLSRSQTRRSADPKRKRRSLFSKRDPVQPTFAEQYRLSAAPSVPKPCADSEKMINQMRAELEALVDN